MSNIDAAHALLRAINYDDFDAILAAHHPEVSFQSFRGPNLRDSLAVRDWQREFQESYADCTYNEVEAVEEGPVVALRATIDAKGYDWREFTQDVVEVLEFDDDGLIVRRRFYAQRRDLQLDKDATAAVNAAKDPESGSVADTKKTVTAFYDALLTGETGDAKALIAEKSAYIDSVYGVVAGADAIMDMLGQIPRPPFGNWRRTGMVCGDHAALVELAVDPHRPRAADWVRVVDGKIAVIEAY